MKLETIQYTITADVAYVRFSRPDVRNAINMQMLMEMEKVLHDLKDKKKLVACIFTGEGKAFCAGADTTEFLHATIAENEQFLQRFWRMTQQVERLPMPTIGLINGYAFGGGAEIAIACDFRIATSKASFRFPGASYGLVVSSHTLPLIVGLAKAKELLFRSRIVDTEEALRIGLVDDVIAPEETKSYVANMLTQMKGNSLPAIRKLKEVLHAGIGKSAEERWRLEEEANDYLVEHTNYRETFQRFVDSLK